MRAPQDLITIVFTAATFDDIVANKWLMPAVYEAIQNSDVCLFATHEEIPQIVSFYSNAKYSNENVGIALCAQMVPWPVCHLFTLESAMGQPLENGEIITPAVTLGRAGSGIPPEKFNTSSKFMPFFLRDEAGDPMIDRLIPAVKGVRDVSIIQPAKLLSRILNALLADVPEDCTWDGIFGEAFKGIETDDKLQEARTELVDQLAKYKQALAEPEKQPL